MKKPCECGLYIADAERARREHLKSTEHKSRMAASKQAGALGGFIKKRPAFPTPKQIAEAEQPMLHLTVPVRSKFLWWWCPGYPGYPTGCCTTNKFLCICDYLTRSTCSCLGLYSSYPGCPTGCCTTNNSCCKAGTNLGDVQGCYCNNY